MHTYVMTATLSAAALTLSLALATPALARSGDHAQQRKFHRTRRTSDPFLRFAKPTDCG
jgi:hypothetical protein